MNGTVMAPKSASCERGKSAYKSVEVFLNFCTEIVQ